MDIKVVLGRRLFNCVMFKAHDLVEKLKWISCSGNNGMRYYKRGELCEKA